MAILKDKNNEKNNGNKKNGSKNGDYNSNDKNGFKQHHANKSNETGNSQKNSTKGSAYERANIISRLYCWYVYAFLRQQYKKEFNLDAIDDCTTPDQCTRLTSVLRHNWMRELERHARGRSASLLRAMIRSFGWKFFWSNVLNFIVYGVFRMLMPLLLGFIIRYSNRYLEEKVLLGNNSTDIFATTIGSNISTTIFATTIESNISMTIFDTASTTTIGSIIEDNGTTPLNPNIDQSTLINQWLQFDNRQNVLFFSTLLTVLVFINVLVSHPYFFLQYRNGMQIRVALTGLVFEKALRIPNQTVQKYTIGKIVNLISNDANRYDIAYVYVSFVYLALVETAVGMAIMYTYIGRSCFGSLAVILLYIPFQSIMANILSRFRSASIILTDDRLRLMAEILPAMRVIKMYVWEKPFAHLVHVARKVEISKIRQSMILRSINLALYFVSPKMMGFICLILYLLDGGQLTAETVFVTLALIAQLREIITYMFPMGVSYTVEGWISTKRIQTFLLEDEIDQQKGYGKSAGAVAAAAATASKMIRYRQIGSQHNMYQESKITLNNVTVRSELNGVTILENISFEVVPGKLTVIIGPVGSGKSSTLLSILNELPIVPPGNVSVQGRVIYVSQEAWIFNGTVRDNILFGNQFDPVRYKEVVKMASLLADFKQFDDGDQTMVDDRGTSLSGGQRARISLARALYTDADCYLLDDPLSAVDAAVAKHLFEQCIKQYLKNKCVILVTHQLQFIKAADQIVVLKDGSCLASGSYTDLLAQGIDVFKYSAAAEPAKVPSSDGTGVPEQAVGGGGPTCPDSPYLGGGGGPGGGGGGGGGGAQSPVILTASQAANIHPFRFRLDSIGSEILYNVSRRGSFIESELELDAQSINYDQISILDYMHNNVGPDDGDGRRPSRMDSYVSNGDLSDGGFGNGSGPGYGGGGEAGGATKTQSSKFKTYWIYIRAGSGICLFLLFFSANLLTQVLFTGSDYWLSDWTEYHEQLHLDSNVEPSPIVASDENWNKLIYCFLVIGLFGASIIRTVSYFVICMRASVNLHNRIFSSLIEAPIVFFDKTPVGIIMNRVSRDLGIIDDLLPPTAFEALEILGNSLAVFLICTILNYWIAIPFVFLIVLIFMSTRFYVNTARRLKRLEGVARSPLFNQMASTLTGLATIRSYGVQEMFVERFHHTQDLHTSTFFTFISASRIFGIFLEFICVAFVFSLILVMNLNLDAYTGSIIGLTISQSLQLTNNFNWGVRQYTEMETYMTSVERIVEFGQLEKEQLDTATVEPGNEWPPRGDIEFDNVSLSYHNNTDSGDDDIEKVPRPVLSGLTFSIRGGEKIGIVGRTGAGKSSLITTLFRLTQPTGIIRIDGVDTGAISLSRLRRALSIIPQEPILFSGNIRRNLDPFNEKCDHELWDAVEKVQLRAKIASLPAQLDSPVSECGSDFSVGQKQLICLARAILRKNRILILDEATANVDPRTDELIQNTIRTEFGRCTVLTIAHRLNTIIDYDRVLVLDAGTLAQFDSPYALIAQKSGIFYELYSNLNPDTKLELKRQAKKAYQDREGLHLHHHSHHQQHHYHQYPHHPHT